MLLRGQDNECDKITNLDFRETFIGTSPDVRLLLYTTTHNFSREPLFNVTQPTNFVIHGYRPTGAPPVWIDHITHLLVAQANMNILVVDWNRGAANLNYFTTVANTRYTATNITGFIQRMRDEGASLDSIHLIGVSLGAHVAGYIGAMLGGRVGRITAFGLRGTYGHIDFYANGGLDQPGCPKTIFSGRSYFVCDHQRFGFLYLCALNHTCSITAYSDFLSGQCLQCEAFKPASCPVLVYDLSQWRNTLLKLSQTRVYFSTTAEPPYRSDYRVGIITWNLYLRWGVVTIYLHSGKNVTESRIDHKLLRFEKYTATRLLAQFDEELYPIQKISLRIATGNVIGPRYNICIQITLHSSFFPRPLMWQYNIIMEENAEVTFQRLPCDGSCL
uniref:Lipase domain-containing protein n=1 Tax=Electrophorus electricus TaxID=8005 RepID=A0A4W4FWD7_ELEEL